MIGVMFSTIMGCSVGFEIADQESVDANGDDWAFLVDLLILRITVFKAKAE